VAKRGSPARRGTTWSAVCKLALKRPGVEEGTSCGTPALHVRKRFLARLKEDGESIAIRVDFADRDVLLEMDPAAFYLTDHYRPYPAMLVRLKQVRLDLLEQILDQAWRRQAPKGLLPEATRDGVDWVLPARTRSVRRRVKRA
jgi:hypothetical protein